MKLSLAKLGLSVAVGALGFAVGLGFAQGRGAERLEKEKRNGKGQVVTALLAKGTNERSVAMREIARDPAVGMFARMRAYLRLVDATPTEELGELLRTIDREVPWEMGGAALAELVGERWIAEDPEAAFEAWLAQDPESLATVPGVLGGMVAHDAERAWVMVGELESIDERRHKMGSVLELLVKSDPERAFDLAKTVDEHLATDQTFRKFFRDLIETNPVMTERVFEFARERSPWSVGSSPFTGFALDLFEKDREQAFRLIDELKGHTFRDAVVEEVAGKWASSEPSGALQWVQGLPRSKDRDTGLATVAAVVSNTDPGRAGNLIEQIRSVEERLSAAESFVRKLSAEAPSAALDWVDSTLCIEGEARTEALDEILWQMGREEFDAQLALANRLCGATPACGHFAQRWAKLEPMEAAEWAVGWGSEEAVTDVVSAWMRSAPEDAVEFVGGIGDRQLRSAIEKKIEPIRRQIEWQRQPE